MSKENMFTRREAMQAMAAAVASAVAPQSAFAVGPEKDAEDTWPGASGQNRERLQAFNENWRFHRGDIEGAEAADFVDSDWRLLDVPHDWSIEDLPRDGDSGIGTIWTDAAIPVRTGPFDMYASEGEGATGWMVGGVGWYRKKFRSPQSLSPGGKVELRFEGVYMNCDVWLNGAHLGNHPYGYTEFAFDLTPHLRAVPNTIAVRVNNAGRNSRWYSGSGIFRKVWLSVAGELRIPAHGIYVTTPEVAADTALVNLAITVENGAAGARDARIRTRLLDAAGVVVGVADATL